MKTQTIITTLIITVLLFAVMFARLLYLQKYQASYFRENSEKQRSTTIVERPQRGVILDRRGRILAASNKVAGVVGASAGYRICIIVSVNCKNAGIPIIVCRYAFN